MPSDLYLRFRTLTPLFQSIESRREEGESRGILRTLKVYTGEEAPVEAPVLSGNSFGGRIRRELAGYLFEELGIDPVSFYGHGTRGQKITYHTLTSGGVLITNEVRLSLDDVEKVKQLLPMFGLLGGVVGGQFITSRCALGHAYPASNELRVLFPTLPDDWFEDFALKDSFTNNGAWTTYRMPEMPSLIGLPEVVSDDQEGKKNPFRNMPVTHGYVLPGYPFVVRFTLHDNATPMDWSMMGLAIERLRNRPFFGGKSKSGFGLVSWERIPEDERLDPSMFTEYVRQNRDMLHFLLTHKEPFYVAMKEVSVS
ncbi:hypothetical protein [Alicyclobacillus macrosporangiidus]|uniref:Uncharacterized protein n=1 Tax=Alicyclobacillus macrosporangiidus TaxID=392015 RepID=A0A1I7KC51_9BACL|nr:hypothetical protein [Alicyclobacillus macrosporangiidus]SFU95028.1 hypothetical protein SAMN05421543_11521 [Alicyclobacillus macrosporangiidus]